MKILAWLMALGGVAVAADWPQWLGPNRDGTWEEEGVIAEFPETGPNILWRVPVGLGYSGPAVAGGKVFVMDFQKTSGELINNAGKAVKLEGTERVLCFDAETGKLDWKHETERPYELSYPGGPRATVTISGGKAYALGGMGDLMCLDAESGELLWEKNLAETYESSFPIWGFAAHPLVHDGLVVTMAGGEGTSVVALDAASGEEKWTALSSEQPGYCPPTVIEWAGVEQMIVWTPEAVAALKPENGEVLWEKPLKPNYHMSLAAPQFSDGLLFASGPNRVGALFRLDPDKPDAEFVWRGKPNNALYSVNPTPVIVGDTIYGADVDTSKLMAVNLEDGERLWETSMPVMGVEEPSVRHGTVFLTRHTPSGRFYLFNEIGELIIAEFSPEKYTELAKAKVIEPTNESSGRKMLWSAPAFALKSAFVRNDEEMIRVSLAE